MSVFSLVSEDMVQGHEVKVVGRGQRSQRSISKVIGQGHNCIFINHEALAKAEIMCLVARIPTFEYLCPCTCVCVCLSVNDHYQSEVFVSVSGNAATNF